MRRLNIVKKVLCTYLFMLRRNFQKMASESSLLTAVNLAQMNKHQDLAVKVRSGTISHSSANNTLNNESTSNLHINQSINMCNVSAIENQLDALSIASSTHFTMINGFGAASKKAGDGRGCCCCKPIAAVIITMTGLLFLIIFGAIFFTECKSIYFNIVYD